MGWTVVANGQRRCITCGINKSLSEFYRHPYTTTQGKLSERSESRCKDCARARRNDRYRSDPERDRVVSLAWKRANRAHLVAYAAARRADDLTGYRLAKRESEGRRRARKGGISAGDETALLATVLEEARIGGRYLDAYTGDLIDDPQVDHIVALALGGAHAYENLCVTSKANNSRKRTLTLAEFLLRKKRGTA